MWVIKNLRCSNGETQKQKKQKKKTTSNEKSKKNAETIGGGAGGPMRDPACLRHTTTHVDVQTQSATEKYTPIVNYYRRQRGLKIWNQYHYVVKVPSPTLLVPSLMMPLPLSLPFAATPILNSSLGCCYCDCDHHLLLLLLLLLAFSLRV
jgi:hypothetical protein